jgi:succinyl-diaminopimelate desuccinylase
MQLALTLDEVLHHKYNLKNDHFSPPISTFEPTRKEKNVDAVNIVPGQDAFFFDCRILPEYNVEDVLSDIESIAADFEVQTGARISIEVLQKQATPAESDENAEIVLILKKALVLARGVIASVGGIGGGTCAAFFRKIGVPAVVWSTINEVAHQPNEYCKIENIIGDAKVFALLSII